MSTSRAKLARATTLLGGLTPGLASADPSVADDIRDIRPLILISPWWYWAAGAAAALILVAAMIAIVRAARRRNARALTAEERAQRELARAEALAREGRRREWADVVAQTLRSALAARLGMPACPQTTGELAAFDWASIPEAASVDAQSLLKLLSTCDLTRFARARLDTSALVASTDAARSFIQQLFTKPQAAAAPVSP
jgi:hypothetical protein